MALNDDMPDGMDGMGDFNDFLSTWPGTDTTGVRSPTGSPRGQGRSQPGSPSCDLGDPSSQRSPYPCNGDPLRVSDDGFVYFKLSWAYLNTMYSNDDEYPIYNYVGGPQ